MRVHHSGNAGDERDAHSTVAAGKRSAAARDPGLPSVEGILALQRSAGNAAVVQMLSQIGWPGAAGRHTGDGRQQDPEAEQPPVRRSSVHGIVNSPGRPLDDTIRTEMETRLGADFSGVRVHTDDAARASAAELGARAYTSGDHVVIGEGGEDEHTLAHELTHVIQQRQGPVTGTDTEDGLRVSEPTDRFEREAEAVATRALAQPPPNHTTPPDHNPTHSSRAGTAQIQRTTGGQTDEMDLDGGLLDSDLWDIPKDQRTTSEANIVDTVPENFFDTSGSEDETFAAEADQVDDHRESSDTDMPDIPNSVESDNDSEQARMTSGVTRNAERDQETPRSIREGVSHDRSAEDKAKLEILDNIAETINSSMRESGSDRPFDSVWFNAGWINIRGNSSNPTKKPQREKVESDLERACRNGSLTKGVFLHHVDEDWRKQILAAIEGKKLMWVEDREQERGTTKHWHGELLMLKKIVDKYTAKQFFTPSSKITGPPNKEKEKEKEFLGGNKMPCPPCRWVIDAVNDTLGEQYGFEVEVWDSHGSFYYWDLPKWFFVTDDPYGHYKKIRDTVASKAQASRDVKKYNAEEGHLTTYEKVFENEEPARRHRPPKRKDRIG